MRCMIALIVLLLVAAAPGAAQRCSLGGCSGSYNFLGDPAVDISMDSYDEFVRENSLASPQAAADAKAVEASRLTLNLENNSRISLLLSQKGGTFSGSGNMTSNSEILPVEAEGSLSANVLTLEVAASDRQYKFSLACEGSTVLGDYSEIMHDGAVKTGLAEGKWAT